MVPATKETQMKNNAVRRTLVQTTLAPSIHGALAAVPGLDLNREEDRRRVMRAVVHVVGGLLLDKGANPNALLAACVEAISKELEALASQHEGGGTFPQAGADA
jgi:hypothetical protein